jgi:hypothetical protein
VANFILVELVVDWKTASKFYKINTAIYNILLKIQNQTLYIHYNLNDAALHSEGL